MNVNQVNYNYACNITVQIDEEEKRIARRLYYIYGVKPTYNKTTDMAKLHECEMKQFKAEKIVSSKYITLSKNEQEKFIEKRKENKIVIAQNNPKELQRVGAKTKGEQVYLAIQMKKRLEKLAEEKRIERRKEQDKKKVQNNV